MRTTGRNLARFNVDSRRNFFQKLGLGAALFTTPGVFVEGLSRRTNARIVAVEEGPFCRPKPPLDSDTEEEDSWPHGGINE